MLQFYHEQRMNMLKYIMLFIGQLVAQLEFLGPARGVGDSYTGSKPLG